MMKIDRDPGWLPTIALIVACIALAVGSPPAQADTREERMTRFRAASERAVARMDAQLANYPEWLRIQLNEARFLEEQYRTLARVNHISAWAADSATVKENLTVQPQLASALSQLRPESVSATVEVTP